jgi:hypothetical protein
MTEAVYELVLTRLGTYRRYFIEQPFDLTARKGNRS